MEVTWLLKCFPIYLKTYFLRMTHSYISVLYRHDYDQLQYELKKFSKNLERPQIVVANKMDAPEAQENLVQLQKRIKAEVIPISAKMGTNLSNLLSKMREYYDKYRMQSDTI